MMSAEQVSSVLGPEYKKPFRVFMAVFVAFIAFFMGVRGVESFVDGRVDMKMATQKTIADDHEKRLTKIEEKLGSMNDVLAEIRSDVKVMRAQMEKK